jgi:hypothetical protein
LLQGNKYGWLAVAPNREQEQAHRLPLFFSILPGIGGREARKEGGPNSRISVGSKTTAAVGRDDEMLSLPGC